MCGYHFTLYHSTYVVSSFWIHLKLFGSFQTKLNFLDHFRLNYFLCLRQKINFFSEKAQNGPKWPNTNLGPFWTTLKHLGHWQAAMFCHSWELMFFQFEKLIIFLYLFEIQLYLGGCLAEGISSGEPSPGLARAPPSCRNYLPVFPWNLDYISLGLKSYLYLKYSAYCFLL